MRVKQRVAKAVHIIAAMSLGLLAHGLVTWLGPVGGYWLNWPISIVVGLYAVAILFSKTPVPLSRAARLNLREYEAWCRVMGKQPSQKEYMTDSWKTDETYVTAMQAVNTLEAKGITFDQVRGLTNDQLSKLVEGDSPEKLSISKLREWGVTKLADEAERTIKRLREAGAPPDMFGEDEVIRVIIKKAGQTVFRGRPPRN